MTAVRLIKVSPLSNRISIFVNTYIGDRLGKKFHLFALCHHFLTPIRLKGAMTYAELYRFAFLVRHFVFPVQLSVYGSF